jgi:hypothetical protein
MVVGGMLGSTRRAACCCRASARACNALNCASVRCFEPHSTAHAATVLLQKHLWQLARFVSGGYQETKLTTCAKAACFAGSEGLVSHRK